LILKEKQMYSNCSKLKVNFSISSLTKIIEKIIKIYDIKSIYYKNIDNEEYNDTYLIS
jgi:hypothetical protein